MNVMMPGYQLEKEFSMMKDYMFMERIRFGKNMEMEVQIKGNASQKSIAPLLLLPFIENSFRLCNAGTEQSWINLEISIEEAMLTMKLMNGVDQERAGMETASPDIVNVQKRLQLIYPDSHELKMYAEQEIYMTLLRINLNDRMESQSAFQPVIFRNEKPQHWYATN